MSSRHSNQCDWPGYGQDNCGIASVFYSDAVSNQCAGTKVISRTWTAVDLCGNSNSCVQTITVQDTLKPTIQCPTNRVVECGSDTGTNATGIATAQDGCGQVTITYADAVSNKCGLTRVISEFGLRPINAAIAAVVFKPSPCRTRPSQPFNVRPINCWNAAMTRARTQPELPPPGYLWPGVDSLQRLCEQQVRLDQGNFAHLDRY